MPSARDIVLLRPLKLNEKAFTLIEMMIVLSIMGAVIAMSMPYISSRNSQNKKFLREFTVLSRELHTKAKLQGVVFRIVLNLQNTDPNVPKAQTYWVEKSNGATVMKPNEEQDAIERAKEAADSSGEKKADPRGFEMDPTTIKEPREIPDGLKITKVELARAKDPLVTGKAFIHFLPQGLADEAAIHIVGEKKQVWTISIHPLTGRAEVITKPISLKELSSQ